MCQLSKISRTKAEPCPAFLGKKFASACVDDFFTWMARFTRENFNSTCAAMDIWIIFYICIYTSFFFIYIYIYKSFFYIYIYIHVCLNIFFIYGYIRVCFYIYICVYMYIGVINYEWDLFSRNLEAYLYVYIYEQYFFIETLPFFFELFEHFLIHIFFMDWCFNFSLDLLFVNCLHVSFRFWHAIRISFFILLTCN